VLFFATFANPSRLLRLKTFAPEIRTLPKVAKASYRGENQCMPKSSPRDGSVAAAQPAVHGPFSAGSMVVVTLGNPRDKFWGMILSLAPEGLSVSGIELASFEDLILMVKDREPFNPAIVFFPMHRIERIELDLPDGTLPSLSQRFSAKTGIEPSVTLSSFVANQGDLNAAAVRSFAAESPVSAHARKDPA
jgi:hypothetical protein